MLTASELTAMRSTVVDSLGGSAIVKTRSWASDGGGGGTTTYTASGTIACRVAPANPDAEAERGDRLQPETEYIFTFAYDAGLTLESLITYAGSNYAVTALRAPRTWELSRRVEAKEVK
jgi:hypothetical protein